MCINIIKTVILFSLKKCVEFQTVFEKIMFYMKLPRYNACFLFEFMGIFLII